MNTIADPLSLTAREVATLLQPGLPALPELEAARAGRARLSGALQTRAELARTEPYLAGIGQIPQTRYVAGRRFARDGDRDEYEVPYYLKRLHLSAAALRVFLDPAGTADLLDAVHDHLWSICEESTWVLPAHEPQRIDLFSAETAFLLAETLTLLGDLVDVDVRHRVRTEVEARVLDPFVRHHRQQWWYQGGNNWNGVCTGATAAAFVLLEPDPGRVAQALEAAFASLRVYFRRAFEADGTSTEGISYWQYGLLNVVFLAEMLHARSGGAIDLLAGERMRRIAAYPAKVLLSPAHFATFSDVTDALSMHPGFLVRLAERTGEVSLRALVTPPAPVAADDRSEAGEQWRLSTALRNILWWDGTAGQAVEIGDDVLASAGIVRLVGRRGDTAPVVLTAKAGHNDEYHNHNDVGSFILHVDGEDLLTDPGRGRYTRQYWDDRTRYDNVFAGSYGHSVPRVAGHPQGAGRAYAGTLEEVETAGPVKRARLELAGAYPVDGLTSLRRELSLTPCGSTVWLEDTPTFTAGPDAPAAAVEEALVTWLDATADGATARIRGQRSQVLLTLEEPAGAGFAVERLEHESRENAKPGVLTRLSVTVPGGGPVRIRMDVTPVPGREPADGHHPDGSDAGTAG
jgi:hypothetical protein